MITRPIVSPIVRSLTCAATTARGAQWSPAQLFANGEQGAWYDPSNLATLFQDYAGTVPVVADGDPVRLIIDRSPNGNNLGHPSANFTYRTENGLHWLEVAGGARLSAGPINMTAFDSVSAFVGVRKALGIGLPGDLIGFSGDPLVNPAAFLLSAPTAVTNTYGFASLLASAESPGAYPDSADNVVTGQASILGDLTQLRADGALVATSLADQVGTTYGDWPLYVGSRGVGGFAFNGRIYGLIVASAFFAQAIVELTEQYLAAKSGVTL